MPCTRSLLYSATHSPLSKSNSHTLLRPWCSTLRLAHWHKKLGRMTRSFWCSAIKPLVASRSSVGTGCCGGVACRAAGDGGAEPSVRADLGRVDTLVLVSEAVGSTASCARRRANSLAALMAAARSGTASQGKNAGPIRPSEVPNVPKRGGVHGTPTCIRASRPAAAPREMHTGQTGTRSRGSPGRRASLPSCCCGTVPRWSCAVWRGWKLNDVARRPGLTVAVDGTSTTSWQKDCM